MSASDVECIRGACHATAKHHAIELYDLDDDELLGFTREIQMYTRALKGVTRAVKINYEIHGNTTTPPRPPLPEVHG